MQIQNIDNRKQKLHIDGNELRDESGKLIAREEEVPRKLSDIAAERLVTRDLSPRDVSPGPGTQATFSGRAMGAVADVAAPVALTKHQQGSWFGESTDDATKQVLPLGYSAGGQPPEMHPNFTGTAFDTVARGLCALVGPEHGANADYDFAAMAIERLASAHRVDRELRVARLLLDDTKWTAGNVITLAAAAKWNGGASSDPIANLHAGMEVSIFPVTRIIMSEPVHNFYVRNPSVSKYATNDLLQLPPITVARLKNTSSGAIAYAWGTTACVLICEPETPTSLSTARTLRWDSPTIAAEQITNGILVRQFFDPHLGGRGSRYVAVIIQEQEVMIGPSLGALIKGAGQ